MIESLGVLSMIIPQQKQKKMLPGVEQYILSRDEKYQLYHHMWKVKNLIYYG